MNIFELGVVVSTVVSIVMGLMLVYERIRGHALYIWVFSLVLMATILIAFTQLVELLYQGIDIYKEIFSGVSPSMSRVCAIIILFSVIVEAIIGFLYYKDKPAN